MDKDVSEGDKNISAFFQGAIDKKSHFKKNFSSPLPPHSPHGICHPLSGGGSEKRSRRWGDGGLGGARGQGGLEPRGA
jgi:hypothetical protein